MFSIERSGASSQAKSGRQRESEKEVVRPRTLMEWPRRVRTTPLKRPPDLKDGRRETTVDQRGPTRCRSSLRRRPQTNDSQGCKGCRSRQRPQKLRRRRRENANPRLSPRLKGLRWKHEQMVMAAGGAAGRGGGRGGGRRGRGRGGAGGRGD